MPAYSEISPNDAHQRLNEFRVVDVRGDGEFHGPLGRIGGSTLIPLPDLSDRAGEIPSRLPILLVCRSGKRSGIACELLAKLEIGRVTNLAGGMIAWNNAKLPIDHTEPASLEALTRLMIAWLVQVSQLTADAADELVLERCALLCASLDAPQHDAVSQVIDFIENLLADDDAPADLELSIHSFRRSLASL